LEVRILEVRMASPWPNTLVFKRNLRRALAAALLSFGGLVFGALVAADAGSRLLIAMAV
jgi:hypothetical protein